DELHVGGASVQRYAVLRPTGLIAGITAADHVHVELRHDRVAWYGGVIGEIAGAEQALFLGGVPHEKDRALRLRLEAGDPLGDLERGDRAGAVVVRSVRDRVVAPGGREEGAKMPP